MSPHRTRREFLGLATAGLAVAAGCSRDRDTGASTGSGPVKITHLFGGTTVPGPPKRVVSAGLTEQDDLLAVGVVPIAVTRWLGYPSGVGPWAQSKLGDAKPALLDLDNGIQVDAIAALKPDLIVAINAGLDADTYTKLSAIAPTIAQSGSEAYFEPWKQQADTVGRAVYNGPDMTRAVEDVEGRFTAAAHPAFANRSVALMNVSTPVDLRADVVSGWRTEFLTAMGFTVASDPANADVVIWCTDTAEQRTALLADPAVAGLRATRQGRSVFTPGDLTAAIAFASPLSYPVVADQLPALLAKALT